MSCSARSTRRRHRWASRRSRRRGTATSPWPAPGPLDDHPGAAARLASAIVEAARTTPISATEHVQVRVGVHTGPVFAGVVGESRFHYQVFGETVNVASRIQHESVSGRVLVSATTYKRIHDVFNLEEHGTVELKGH